MAIGPLMLDLQAEEISAEEKEILQHPYVGAVILFTRNYHDPQQLRHLLEQINIDREEPLLIAVDHEGGRVQRFRSGFHHIPAAGSFRTLWDQGDAATALTHAKAMGWLMAAQLREMGVDFSFAPVLDLDYGVSEVIGDRAFHRQPQVVSQLAGAAMMGMRQAGMAATGKHFPGHGAVALDSHTDLPVDERSFEMIALDLLPFTALFAQGLQAVMPAHVIYSQVDPKPAGFSSHWLQNVLRKQLHFQGVIFSDDLNMAATHHLGDFPERAQAALQAGCDMVLVCNNRRGAVQVLDQHQQLTANPDYATRLETMRGTPRGAGVCASDSPPYRDAMDILQHYETVNR